MVKICRGCQKELPLSEYYGHPYMFDKHLNYCKECVKDKTNAHREQNLDRIREYDRARGQLPRRAKRNTEATSRRRKEVPGYMVAHNKIERAVKTGMVKKPNNCKECGSLGRLEAHHVDYTKPLDVVWLCVPCHRALHLGKTEKAERLRAKYPLQMVAFV